MARVLRAHVGRVVAPSIITMLGLDLGAAVGGVLFVELVFGLPGLGFVAVNSIQNLDYPVTVGVVTFTGLLTVGAMTLADLAVAVPRSARPETRPMTRTAKAGARRELVFPRSGRIRGGAGPRSRQSPPASIGSSTASRRAARASCTRPPAAAPREPVTPDRGRCRDARMGVRRRLLPRVRLVRRLLRPSDQRLYRVEAGGSPIRAHTGPRRPRASDSPMARPLPDGTWAAYVQETHAARSAGASTRSWRSSLTSAREPRTLVPRTGLLRVAAHQSRRTPARLDQPGTSRGCRGTGPSCGSPTWRRTSPSPTPA